MSSNYSIHSSDSNHLIRLNINPDKLNKKDRKIQKKENRSVLKLPYIETSSADKGKEVDRPRWYQHLFIRRHYPKSSAIRLNQVWIEDKKNNRSYLVNKNELARQLGVNPTDIHKHLIKAKGESNDAVLDQKYIEKRLKKLHHSAYIIQKSYEKMSKNLIAGQPAEKLIRKTEKKLKKAIGNDLKHKGIIDKINREMRNADPHSPQAFLNVVNRHAWWQIPNTNRDERTGEGEAEPQPELRNRASSTSTNTNGTNPGEAAEEGEAEPQPEPRSRVSSSTSANTEASASTEDVKQRYKDNPQLREQKNLEKAVIEHILSPKSEAEKEVIYALAVHEIREKDRIPSSFSCCYHTEQGKRPSNEDAHLMVEIPSGRLLAIFDGHGGDQAARYAANNFSAKFQEILGENPHDIPFVMKKTAFELDSEIQEADTEDAMGGSTASIGFIDQDAVLHAATIGDSEIKVFRKIQNKMYSIPLSCVRDWSSPKDEARFLEAYKEHQDLEDWKEEKGKLRRYPIRAGGINVSRSLGDKSAKHLIKKHEGKVMRSNPKTTAFALQKEDLVINACDGLWDFVDDATFIRDVLEPNWDKPEVIAQAATQYALDKGSGDNISVMAVKCS